MPGTQSITWTRRDVYRKHRIVMIRVYYSSGLTGLTVPTGLKKIYSYEVSPTSVAGKGVTGGTVVGGVITLVVTNLTTDNYGYLYVTAEGI